MLESHFNKVASLQTCNFIKMTRTHVFSGKFVKCLGAPNLKNIYERLLSKIPLRELIIVCGPANCSFLRKKRLHRYFAETPEIASSIFYTLCHKEHVSID